MAPASSPYDDDLESRHVSVADVLESDCRIICEYWESRRYGRFAPTWKEFDLQGLPTKVIAFTRVADVQQDPFDIVYRFWGTGLVKILGEERTGKSLANWPASRVPHAMKKYEAVIQERAPYALVYNTRTQKPLTPLFAPAIRLPLSDDGETVDKIVTYADFNADRIKWRAFFKDRK